MAIEDYIIYILLPIYNRLDCTKLFINSLKEQTYKNYHLILIDDGSIDGSSEYVSQYLKNVSIIKGNGHWWWAGALEQGYKWLKKNVNNIDQSIVLIINNDVIFENNFLEQGLTLIKKNPHSLILSKLYDIETKSIIDNGKIIDWAKYQFRNTRENEESNCFSTRGLFLRLSDMFSIGKFRPYLLPHYASDYEYTIRAHKKGYKLITNDNLFIYSQVKPSGIQEKYTRSVFSKNHNVFSRKNPMNPYYMTIFLILTCPFKYLPQNLFRVWKRGFKI